MGKTFVRRVLAGELGTPKKILVMSRDEAKQHDMRMSYLHMSASTDEVIYRNSQNVLEFRIGDVRNYADVSAALHNIDIVINAAALKQVPTCEYFPQQAVLTNCEGASNITRAIQDLRFPIETVLGVSTDKACKPVNVMGMTKAIQERIFISANVTQPETRYICVRYGNVLASRGSVVPLFHDQIAKGGPLTITNPDMTRFLLSLNQAVDTIFAALQDGLRGEIFVPIAPSANILNLAKALIGDRKIEIKMTGNRPGEKLHELMVSEDEAYRCRRVGQYYAIQPMLPELYDDTIKPVTDRSGEYSSGSDVLDLQGTVALLREHSLMLDQVSALQPGEELLR